MANDRLVIRTINRYDQEPFALYSLHETVRRTLEEDLKEFIKKHQTHLENLADQMDDKGQTAWKNKLFNNLNAFVDCWEKLEDHFVRVQNRTDRQFQRDRVDFMKAAAATSIAEANAAFLTEEQITRLHNRAEKLYRNFLKKYPNDATAYNNLGNLLAENEKRWEEAEVAYNQAIEINPNDADAYSNLGALLAENEKRWDDAEDAFRKAIEINPNYTDAYNNLGLLLYKNEERWAEVEDAFRKVIEINPNDADTHFNLACLQSISMKDENKDEAFMYLKKAIELDSKNKELAKTDSDFDFIRDDERFQELIKDEGNRC